MTEAILVIGSANADYVIRTAKMPLLGETVTGSEFAVNAGGKGLNQAVAIAKLGGEVTFCGAVGKDANGAMLLDELNACGVSFNGTVEEDATTGVAMITVVNGDNCIVLHEGANAMLTPQKAERYRKEIGDAAYCVMQLEIPLETVERVCEIAAQTDTNIVLNPAPYRALPPSVLSKVAYLIPNEHEARELVGFPLENEEACRQAVRCLLCTGVKHVVITLGERGCVYNVGDDISFCPARATTVVDTTSAGDCFIGALVSRLSKGATVHEAVAFATKASSIAVSRKGASKSIPSESEVERLTD